MKWHVVPCCHSSSMSFLLKLSYWKKCFYLISICKAYHKLPMIMQIISRCWTCEVLQLFSQLRCMTFFQGKFLRQWWYKCLPSCCVETSDDAGMVKFWVIKCSSFSVFCQLSSLGLDASHVSMHATTSFFLYNIWSPKIWWNIWSMQFKSFYNANLQCSSHLWFFYIV
jgi:hypothetical protein